MRLLFVLLLFVTLASCGDGKTSKAAYQRECTGDHSVSCRNKMIDVAIAEAKDDLKAIEGKHKEIATCIGESGYDQGIKIAKARIDYFDDIRPNIFYRTVLSGMEIEFNPPPFELEGEKSRWMRSLSSCHQTERQAAQTSENNASPSPQANSVSQSTVDACVDTKVAEFRKEKGDEPLISSAMLNEWEVVCRN